MIICAMLKGLNHVEVDRKTQKASEQVSGRITTLMTVELECLRRPSQEEAALSGQAGLRQ